MKQSVLERRRVYKEIWHDWIRWAVMFFIVGALLIILIMFNFHSQISFLPFFVLFLLCLATAWIIFFLKKDKRKEFVGDK